jgi:DNA-directed RNA polymerase subunit RPC12/RpoP
MLFSTAKCSSVAKCPKCGTLCKTPVSGADVALASNRPVPDMDKAVQNFKCLSCGNEFQLIVTDPRHTHICRRCKSTKLKPISPIAYVVKPRKDKKASKFMSFIKAWGQNYTALERDFNNIEYLCKVMGLGFSYEIDALKKKVLRQAIDEKDRKLGISGK